jgi:SAM-dependent methyltransferase
MDEASGHHHAPPTTAEAWDERYGSTERVWSGNPNVALVAEVGGLPPGRVLDVGCGEGADAIWLAQRGWRVTAIDISRVGIDRARAHADALGVDVEWVVTDIRDAVDLGEYDLVSVFYPPLLKSTDRRAERALIDRVAPGGTLLVVHHAQFDREHAEAHGFDPDDYIGPDDVAAALDPAWTIEVHQTRPRHVTEGAGAHHVDDRVLRARRP